MNSAEITTFIDDMPDDVLKHVMLSMPWQMSEAPVRRDPDGKPDAINTIDDDASRKALQEECWRKFKKNPQINTSIRGMMGRITGLGFETVSDVYEIQEVIREIEYDPRNRLYSYWPKFVGRAGIEGELFLCCTCHDDGFIEVDFIDPSEIDEGGDDGTGIVFHPKKKLMPLFYNVGSGNSLEQIPSIFVARYPNLVQDLPETLIKPEAQRGSKDGSGKFSALGGYKRFIIAWDRGLCTRRAISYLRTTIEWLNHYENLKKYEIDHKKACGSYAWAFEFEDIKAFRRWLALSDAEREKTGMMAKFLPGCRIFLPPGIKLSAKAPQLPQISDSDTDILQMASSGLNEPMDVLTGSLNATFASAKASRGPMSDRVSDEIAWFDRFLKHDFWGSIFFLKSAIADFPRGFRVKEAVDFKKGQPVFKRVPRVPEFLIDVIYPMSETIDLEGRMRAVAGTKHPGLSEAIGLPHSLVAKKVGVGGYGYQRLRKATEDEKYPKLLYSYDAESLQEKLGGEKGKRGTEGDNEEKD